jgi:hypothetical protein
MEIKKSQNQVFNQVFSKYAPKSDKNDRFIPATVAFILYVLFAHLL